jgi:hypothetical protein
MSSRYPPLEEVFPTLRPSARPASPEDQPQKSLKDDIRDDLIKRNVWFNDLELADYHEIGPNHSRILCVFDKYEAALAAYDSGGGGNIASRTGLQSDLYLLFIRVDEYGGEPRIGQNLPVDGKNFYIQSYLDAGGVYEVTLKVGVTR